MAEYSKKVSGVTKIQKIASSIRKLKHENSESHEEHVTSMKKMVADLSLKGCQTEDEVPTFVVPKMYPRINLRVQLPGSTEAIGTFTFVPAEKYSKDVNSTQGAQEGAELRMEKFRRRSSISSIKKGFMNAINKGRKTPEKVSVYGNQMDPSSVGDLMSSIGSTNTSIPLNNCDEPDAKSPIGSTNGSKQFNTDDEPNAESPIGSTNGSKQFKSDDEPNAKSQIGRTNGSSELNTSKIQHCDRESLHNNNIANKITKSRNEKKDERDMIEILTEEFGPQVREKINLLMEESNNRSKAWRVENDRKTKLDFEKIKWEEPEIIESSSVEDLGFELI